MSPLPLDESGKYPVRQQVQIFGKEAEEQPDNKVGDFFRWGGIAVTLTPLLQRLDHLDKGFGVAWVALACVAWV